jgi:hypothetical protein
LQRTFPGVKIILGKLFFYIHFFLFIFSEQRKLYFYKNQSFRNIMWTLWHLNIILIMLLINQKGPCRSFQIPNRLKFHQTEHSYKKFKKFVKFQYPYNSQCIWFQFFMSRSSSEMQLQVIAMHEKRCTFYFNVFQLSSIWNGN